MRNYQSKELQHGSVAGKSWFCNQRESLIQDIDMCKGKLQLLKVKGAFQILESFRLYIL